MMLSGPPAVKLFEVSFFLMAYSKTHAFLLQSPKPSANAALYSSLGGFEATGKDASCATSSFTNKGTLSLVDLNLLFLVAERPLSISRQSLLRVASGVGLGLLGLSSMVAAAEENTGDGGRSVSSSLALSMSRAAGLIKAHGKDAIEAYRNASSTGKGELPITIRLLYRGEDIFAPTLFTTPPDLLDPSKSCMGQRRDSGTIHGIFPPSPPSILQQKLKTVSPVVPSFAGSSPTYIVFRYLS